MKLNEITNQHMEIEALLKQYGIKNYTIQSDGTVDVDGDVNLSERDIITIPVNFGKVNGNFSCHSCANLTTLKGAPTYVDGYFDCANCPKMTTFNGFETKIGFKIYCNWVNILSGGISLILSGATHLYNAAGPFKIIEKYLGRPEDIFECQAELIAAGYVEYAQL